MIPITSNLLIDESQIQLHFIRSSGPGGQNVNKVSSAVRLRFDAENCPELSEAVRQRLRRLSGRRMTDEGIIIIEASRFRTQGRNRQDALHRLVELIRAAAEPTKPRVKSRPTWTSVQRRLEGKQQRGKVKRLRKVPAYID